MYGKRKPRTRNVSHGSKDAKHLTEQQKYIDMLIDNVRQYFIKLDQEHKELTTLQAYLLAKKFQSEQEKKSGSTSKVAKCTDEREIINTIKLDLCSRLQESEEEEEDSE